MSKRRLGRGIDALLQGRDLAQLETETVSVINVPLIRLKPNPDQPRKVFDQEALEELARSIEERGIIQPILAEEEPDGSYLIVAGERRYRAAQLAGLTVVPVITAAFSDDEKLEIALIENIQRKDLNALEEAAAYQELMERTGASQEELSRRLGRSRPAIANAVRLLRLPPAVQDAVATGALSAGHARALLALNDPAMIEQAAQIIVEDDLNVRAAERIAALAQQGIPLDQARQQIAAPSGAATAVPTNPVPEQAIPREAARSTDGGTGPTKSLELREFEERLIARLGTRVTIHGSDHRGKIEIAYLSMDDLERVIELIL